MPMTQKMPYSINNSEEWLEVEQTYVTNEGDMLWVGMWSHMVASNDTIEIASMQGKCLSYSVYSRVMHIVAGILEWLIPEVGLPCISYHAPLSQMGLAAM